LDARLVTLLCKRIIVANAKEVKAGWSSSQQHSRKWINLEKSSKEGYGSKGAVLPMMKMMMIIPSS
jgi:hypothetical protein